MAEKQSGSASESPKDPFEGLGFSLQNIRGAKKLSQSPAKVDLFNRLLAQTRMAEGDPLAKASMEDNKKNLARLVAYVNGLTDEQVSSMVSSTGEDLVGTVASAIVPSDEEADKPKSSSPKPTTSATARGQNNAPQKNPNPTGAEVSSDPLLGLHLDGIGYDVLTKDQQNVFKDAITLARQQGKTTEQLNQQKLLADLVTFAKNAKPSSLHAPVSSIVTAQVVTTRTTPTSRPLTNSEKLLLALGVGGVALVGATAVGAGVAAFSGAYQGALNAPTPAVAPAHGVTTFDMPQAQRDVTTLGGGFTAVRLSDGTFELKSDHRNLPIAVTFVMDDGAESTVTQGLMPVPGTDTYVFNIDAPNVRVKYRDISTNQVYETEVAPVK